jgi:hypothetical protein
MPAEIVKARTPEELASIEQSLSIDNVRQFMAVAAEARAALAELHPSRLIYGATGASSRSPIPSWTA